MVTRLLFPAFLLVTLATARPAAAQKRDPEMPAPRTWPVVLMQPLDEAGATLLHEVTSLLELLPDQQLSTRRMQVAGAGGSETAAMPAARLGLGPASVPN